MREMNIRKASTCVFTATTCTQHPFESGPLPQTAFLYCEVLRAPCTGLYDGSVAPFWPQAAMDASALSFVKSVQAVQNGRNSMQVVLAQPGSAVKSWLAIAARSYRGGFAVHLNTLQQAAEYGFTSQCSHAFRQTLREPVTCVCRCIEAP